MSDAPAQSKAVRRNRDTLARKERAAALLASGRSASEVAAEVGVRSEQVSRWRTDPDFVVAEQAARTKALADISETVREYAMRGLHGVAAIADDVENPAPLRLDAYKALMAAGLPKPRAEVDITSGGKPMGQPLSSEEHLALVREAVAAKGKAA